MLIQLPCQELVHLLNERGEQQADVPEIEAAVPKALERGNLLYFTYLNEYDAGVEGSEMLSALAKRVPGVVLANSELTGNRPSHEKVLQRVLLRDIVEQVNYGIQPEIELVRRYWESIC